MWGNIKQCERGQWCAKDFSLGAKSEGSKAKSEVEFFWVGFNPRTTSYRGLGEPCEITSGVRGIAPTARRFSTISALRMASPDTLLLKMCGLSCSNWVEGLNVVPPRSCTVAMPMIMMTMTAVTGLGHYPLADGRHELHSGDRQHALGHLAQVPVRAHARLG